MILDSSRKAALVLCAALFLCACGGGTPRTQQARSLSSAAAQGGVVATTSVLGALVRSVAGDAVAVDTLVPVGSSPETYEPAPQDVVRLSRARVLIENGSGLEAWLEKLVHAAASRHARIIVLSDGVVLAAGSSASSAGRTQQERKFANPHLWLDPKYAEAYVRQIQTALVREFPDRAKVLNANAAAELARLDELHRWIQGQIATVPPPNRAMLTFHDAWYYFDKRYGIRDLGAIESSPGKEPSAAEFAALVNQAKANRVRVIFAEPEFSRKLVDQLAASAGIKTVTTLYDDSLGSDPGIDSYEGMMRHDVNAIVEGLKT